MADTHTPIGPPYAPQAGFYAPAVGLAGNRRSVLATAGARDALSVDLPSAGADEGAPQVEQVAVVGAEDCAGHWVRHRTPQIIDSSSAVLTESPKLSTVGILGGCSFDRPLSI